MLIGGSVRAESVWERFTHHDTQSGDQEVDLRVRFVTPRKRDEIQASFMVRKTLAGGRTIEEVEEPRKFYAALMDYVVVEWGGEGKLGPVGMFCANTGCGKMQYHALAAEMGVGCCECESPQLERRPLPCTKGYKAFFLEYCARYSHSDDPGLWSRVTDFAVRGDRQVPEADAENLEPTPASGNPIPDSIAGGVQ
jgi:hypothetical protein